MKYLVGFGGEPPENSVECASIDDARLKLEELAEKEWGSDYVLWGDSVETGMGACATEDNDGAYGLVIVFA